MRIHRLTFAGIVCGFLSLTAVARQSCVVLVADSGTVNRPILFAIGNPFQNEGENIPPGRALIDVELKGAVDALPFLSYSPSHDPFVLVLSRFPGESKTNGRVGVLSRQMGQGTSYGSQNLVPGVEVPAITPWTDLSAPVEALNRGDGPLQVLCSISKIDERQFVATVFVESKKKVAEIQFWQGDAASGQLKRQLGSHPVPGVTFAEVAQGPAPKVIKLPEGKFLFLWKNLIKIWSAETEETKTYSLPLPAYDVVSDGKTAWIAFEHIPRRLGDKITQWVTHLDFESRAVTPPKQITTGHYVHNRSALLDADDEGRALLAGPLSSGVQRLVVAGGEIVDENLGSLLDRTQLRNRGFLDHVPNQILQLIPPRGALSSQNTNH